LFLANALADDLARTGKRAGALERDGHAAGPPAAGELARSAAQIPVAT
jgi:hypothetical protein